MNKTLSKGIICAVVATVIGACSDGFGTGFDDHGNGTIALTTAVDATLVNARSRAEYNTVETDQLTLRLTSSDGKVYSWNSVTDFDLSHKFPVGAYTLEAFFGNATSEGFENPYFYGTTSFTVRENEATPVTLTARLANALVDIDYSDNFKKYMTDWSAEVHSAGGSYFDYTAAETRPIYTRSGSVSVYVDFTKPNGNRAKLLAAEFTAEARHFYHVKIDITNTAGSGDAVMVVTFDDSLSEQVIEIDISDEVTNAPAPVITPEGFENNIPIEVRAGSRPEEKVIFNIAAYGMLHKAVLTTQSASLLGQGWPSEVEINQSTIPTLQTFGLIQHGLGITDKMAVVELTDVVRRIRYIDGGNNASTFTLLVYDKYGKVSDPVTLSIETLRVDLGFSEGEYYYGEPVISFDLDYNGEDINDLQLQYFNKPYGTWDALTDINFAPKGENKYRVTASISPEIGDYADRIQLRAFGGGSFEQADVASTAEIEVTPLLVVDRAIPANAFAKQAYIFVTAKNGVKESMFDGATLLLATDGANFSAATAQRVSGANCFLVTGITPATDYTVKVVGKGRNPENSTIIGRFTTEQAIALQNGDMEDWTSSSISSGLMSCTVWDCAGWATFNPYTTGYLNASTNYAALSSTLKEDAGNNGSAARIRSVGFDIQAASAGLNNAKKYSHGELFLGTYEGREAGGAVYGIGFASRPNSLSFSYKYTAVQSGNMGYAEITLLDSNGLAIASKSVNLQPTDTFTPVTLYLADFYNKDTSKAAKISVIFRSTYDPAAFVNSTDIPKPSTIIGILAGYYIGSELYIDDIVLNY